MGCDIHVTIEVCKKRDPSGGVEPDDESIWEAVDYRKDLPQDASGKDYYEALWNHPLYFGRNYALFAILAGVRNNFDVTPIAEPRGIPNNASIHAKAACWDWQGDAHSHSWLSLKDLLDHNWNTPIHHDGYVSLDEYRVFRATGKPNGWSMDVGGGSVRKVSNAEMDRLLEDLPPNPASYYTHVTWQESHDSAVGEWLCKETIPALQKLGPPDEVRLVFFFDN